MKKEFLIILLFINMLLTAAVRQTDQGVEFSFTQENIGSVSVAGSFNDWDTNANRLQKDENGIWKAVIVIPEGSYSYKFVVDGNWISDEENPKTVEDGYGGTNSLVEVTGDRASSNTTEKLIKKSSALNPKVYFDGRYYTKNIMIKDDMSRYMLEKPYHDINLGIEVKLNPQMTGYTVLNINNTREAVDMWKTHLNYKRTLLKLDADYFEVNAFDNTGVAVFNDPLNIIGGQGYYDYDFGYDYRGLFLISSSSKIPLLQKLPFDLTFDAIAADQIGDAERDVTASRIQLDRMFDSGETDYLLNFGAAIYDSRVNDNYSHTFNDSMSYSGGIVNSNTAWEIDAKLETRLKNLHWQDDLKMHLGIEHYDYNNKLIYKDYGEDEMISDEEFVWQEGTNDYLSYDLEFPKALKLGVAYQQYVINNNYQVFYDTDLSIPADQYFESELSKKLWQFTCAFDQENLNIDINFKTWNLEYPDSLSNWNEYYRFVERTAGNGKWYQDYSELAYCQYFLLGYDKGMLWNLRMKYEFKKLMAEYEVNIAQFGFNYKPEIIENIVRLKYDFNSKWEIISDTRLPVFNSSFLDLKTDFNDDENVYISNFAAIRYHLSDDVWLSLGFGVNPVVISEVSDQFYSGGRREYLEEVGELDGFLQNMYSNFGEKVKIAEKALADDDRISLEAVIRF